MKNIPNCKVSLIRGIILISLDISPFFFLEKSENQK